MCLWGRLRADAQGARWEGRAEGSHGAPVAMYECPCSQTERGGCASGQGIREQPARPVQVAFVAGARHVDVALTAHKRGRANMAPSLVWLLHGCMGLKQTWLHTQCVRVSAGLNRAARSAGSARAPPSLGCRPPPSSMAAGPPALPTCQHTPSTADQLAAAQSGQGRAGVQAGGGADVHAGGRRRSTWSAASAPAHLNSPSLLRSQTRAPSLIALSIPAGTAAAQFLPKAPLAKLSLPLPQTPLAPRPCLSRRWSTWRSRRRRCWRQAAAAAVAAPRCYSTSGLRSADTDASYCRLFQ